MIVHSDRHREKVDRIMTYAKGFEISNFIPFCTANQADRIRSKKVFATKTLKYVIEIVTIVIEKAAKMTTYYLVPTI